MSAPNWDRLGATAGVVYIVLALTGFAIHGYPKQGASSEELRSWIAATDATRFSLGVYIEALGTVLFIPFAAWLSSLLSGPALHQRWLSNTVVGSAVAFVVLTLPINELYLGSLEAGKQGADVRSVRDHPSNRGRVVCHDRHTLRPCLPGGWRVDAARSRALAVAWLGRLCRRRDCSGTGEAHLSCRGAALHDLDRHPCRLDLDSAHAPEGSSAV